MLLMGSTSFSQEPYEQAWIESGYQSCLQDSLPCECYSFNPPNFIFHNIENTNFMWIDRSYAIANYNDSDTISFDLIDRSLFVKGETDSIYGKVSLVGDSLFITSEDKFIKYILVENWTRIEDASCLSYLNKVLVRNGYDNLYKTLKSDTLTCDCDIQFWISRVHDNKNVWTFERRNSTLYMYKWQYPKEADKKAKKKLFKKYKLKK